MARLVAVYKTPKDPAAFDEYYFKKHLQIAKKIPGLRRYETSDGPVGMPMEPGAVHLVAFLDFDSVEAIQKAFASPEGQAAAADIPNFATGGSELWVMATKEV